MGLWTIGGGNRLYGDVWVQGSKNAALPILAASLLHKGVTVLDAVPQITDVEEMLDILRLLGCSVKREGERVTIDAAEASGEAIPFATMSRVRGSVLFLGALTARFGAGAVPIPRVSRLGPRPLDLHIDALARLGASVHFTDEAVCCRGSAMTGGDVVLAYPSVGATENAMLAACGCSGITVLRNCAKEPEIAELGVYLREIGMHVSGEGTDTVVISKGRTVGTVRHTLWSDSDAAATLLCAGAACGGELILHQVISSHLQPILDVLEEMGCNIKIQENSVKLISDGRLWASGHEIVTGPYPGFPTNMQPLLMAACLRADGVTVFRERVFAGRLRHAKQLRRFGADITLTDDCAAMVVGVPELQAAAVQAQDLRGGAALLIAALQAEGVSTVVDAGHIKRGYAHLDGTLRRLGADLEYTD